MIEPIKIQVRFSDIDVMGHVNNAVYLNYFETARMHYFNQILGKDWNWNVDGIILMRNELDYLKPLLLRDQAIITISVLKIGTKSFELGYDLKVNEVSYTRGKSILVCFNYTEQKSCEIPSKLRSKLQELIVE